MIAVLAAFVLGFVLVVSIAAFWLSGVPVLLALVLIASVAVGLVYGLRYVRVQEF